MTILITGANGGLGNAIARRFLDDPGHRHRVWLGVRGNRTRAEALAGATGGDRCRILSLDVTSELQWREAVDTIIDAAGRLDVLVNNAGLHRDQLLATMSVEEWSAVLDSNLTGAFLGCRCVVRPMMKQRFGRIINIASLSALLAPRGQTNYAAAKAGVVALTQSLAKEVARAGITANAICPGYIDTEALANIPGEEKKRLVAGIPMRRFGTPEEVASAVYFLTCQDAGYVTGSVLKIDGGIL